MRNSNRYLIGSILMIGSILSGCATIIAIQDAGEPDVPIVYGGVQMDWVLVTANFREGGSVHMGDLPWVLVAAATIDLPLSAVADTLLLPLTIPLSLQAESDSEDPASENGK